MVYAIVILIIAGMIGTAFVIREVSHKAQINDIDTDLQRSHEYEATVSSNWGRLFKIYLVMAVVMIIGTLIFYRYFV